jgi:glycosyltransferase involved in cell wall biosynthesis
MSSPGASRRGILFVTPWLLAGGIERVIEHSVPWLRARGYRCEVASWSVAPHIAGQPNPVLVTLAAADIPVRSLRSRGRLQLLQRAVRAAALALKGRHRLLVGYELEGNLVALLAKRLLGGRVRVMAQIHCASAIHAEIGTSPRLLRLARRLYRDADLLVGVSESVRQDSIRFFRLDPSRVVTLYNPLRVSWIREMARQETHLPVQPTVPFVVGCGRLVRLKGFSDLLRAFAIVRSYRPLQLVILGEGPERANLVAAAHSEGVEQDVYLPGFVTNPWSYFRRASAFVLSSLSESFSMVLVEAMACGVPVIASRCEWGPEEILDRGKYGLLYEPGDVDGLARNLKTVLDAPREESFLTTAALRRAEEFSHDAVLPALERQIAGLLERG